VLDPFGGLGTTALAAAQEGRNATLIEINEDYATAAQKHLGLVDRG
jgi:DNA modification methylase